MNTTLLYYTYVYSYYSCEKIIVVLSREFPQNEQCMYLLRVAISKSPGTSQFITNYSEVLNFELNFFVYLLSNDINMKNNYVNVY